MTKRAVLLSLLLTLSFASHIALARDTSWHAPYEAAKKALQQQRPALAEKLFQEALRRAEAGKQDTQSKDRIMIHILYDLASLYKAQSRYDRAAEVYQRCLTTLGKSFGPRDRQVCTVAWKYVETLELAGRIAEAKSASTCGPRTSRP